MNIGCHFLFLNSKTNDEANLAPTAPFVSIIVLASSSTLANVSLQDYTTVVKKQKKKIKHQHHHEAVVVVVLHPTGSGYSSQEHTETIEKGCDSLGFEH